MALKKYIGARYAPKFMGAWDKESQYAALSVVYYNDQSFVSRKTVPANTEILNTEFWIKSADWNAQVTQYNQHVEEYNQNVEKYNQNVEAYQQAVSKFYADTLHSYDTKADMVADQDLQLGDTLLTCGDKTIGDTGGSFYQVVAETSAKAVALANGLYALPFEFQPYDYAEFAEKTDQYKQETDKQIAQMKEVSLHTYNTQNQMKADRSLTANTVVMTAGEAAIGDNKGSFFNVQQTSDKTDAVPLDNGMKAVPFAMNVGTIAGNALTFNGKSEVAGIWNAKAPATLTIPLSVPQGGTATTYLAVLYGSTSATVTANVTVNGTNKALTFSDKADSGYDKFAVYAITAKNTDQLYWSQATVSSWQTEYKTAAIDSTAELGTNAPSVYSQILSGFGTTVLFFRPTKTITLENIRIKLPVYESVLTASITLYEYPTAEYNDNARVELANKTLPSKVPTETIFNAQVNNTLTSNKYYKLQIILIAKTSSALANTPLGATNSCTIGTYGAINVIQGAPGTNDVLFNGVISYKQ